MQHLTSIASTVWFAIGIVVVFAILIALEIFNSMRMNKITYPVYEYALKRAENEADHIIAAAREEARQLIERVTAENMSMATARKTETDAAGHAYDETFTALPG